VYSGPAASVMFTPFFCHWYKNGGVPAAAILKAAVVPSFTEVSAGCNATLGGA